MNTLRIYLREGVNVSIVMQAGDIVAQTLLEKTPLRELDVARTLKFGSIGLFIIGPAVRYWYGLLDRRVSKNQSIGLRAFKKMALDQCSFSPILTLVATAAVSAIQGEIPQQTKERIQNDYFTIMGRNYMVWPAVQMINFSIVPIQYQVIFVQMVSVLWNCYLSTMLNKPV